MSTNKRSQTLLTAILALLASVGFLVAYGTGHNAAFVAVAMVFLIVSLLAFRRWRGLPT